MASQHEFINYALSRQCVTPEYTLRMLDFLQKSHESIKDFKLDHDTIKALTSTPKEIIDLCTHARKYADYCNAFLSSSVKFKPVFNLPTKKEIVDDFTAIKGDLADGEVITYDTYSQGFLLTRNVVMNDVYRDIQFDFGQFNIFLKPDRAEMSPIKNNTKRNDQYHPYIIRGTSKICLGTYNEPYIMAMSSLRYHAAYTLVIQCITEYGGDMLNGSAAGPQNPIELWVGQICSICDGQVNTEDISVCGKTHRAICPSCVDTGICTDEVDGEVYHSDVIKLCKTCNKKTSTVIRSKCLSCRQKALVGV